jgi:2-phosphoglycerate kinase
MSDRRPPESLGGEEGRRLPYSKGLMAKTLSGTGLRPERAYELARLIEQELVREHEEHTFTEVHLNELVARVLAEHEGEDAVRGLRRYRVLQELDLPLILLIGGATGTGKSTVTTEVAHRLGITRVASTDFVRQTMRAFFSVDFMPSIHYSSFEAAAAVATPDEANDPTLVGFNDQTRNVLVGVRAVIGRALTERYSMALEGVHVVPGLVPAAVEGAVVVQALLAIEDEDEHARHFWVRDTGSEGLRPVAKYLDSLGDIRRIQAYLIERAEKVGVPVIENTRVERTAEAVIRLVLEQVERAVGTPTISA